MSIRILGRFGNREVFLNKYLSYEGSVKGGIEFFSFTSPCGRGESL
jgi:hypothetical protein